MYKVFINGYGIIGGRLASALSKDKLIKLVGIAKYSSDAKTLEAINKGLNVYVPPEMIQTFQNKNFKISGTIEDAIEESDIVVDAASEGKGFDNKIKFYEPMKKKTIFQGGEDRHGKRSVADIIHNSRVNLEKTKDKNYVIQGSCNVTGMGKIIQPLIEKCDGSITRFDVNLVRRWADLEDKKDVKDSIEWEKHPHHQNDLKDFLPSVNLYVDAIKVPSRMMHLHQMTIRFKNKPPSKDMISDIFSKEFAVAILNKAKGTADVRKKAMELGFDHGDTNMVHIHNEMTRVQEDIIKIFYSDDQTGMVIPENYMLIQSMLLKKSRTEVIKQVDKIFNISKKKKMLEEQL